MLEKKSKKRRVSFELSGEVVAEERSSSSSLSCKKSHPAMALSL